MTPAEVINSWNSTLVDKMRSLSDSNYMDTTYIDLLKTTMKVPSTDMHEYMKTFTAIFSLIERTGGDKFDYCEPKNALRYVQSTGPTDDDPNAPDSQFPGEEIEPLWNRFINGLNRYFELIKHIKQEDTVDVRWCPLTSESYSYFHYINNDLKHLPIDRIIPVLKEFIVDCIQYKIESGRFNKILKKAHINSQTDVDEAREGLTSLKDETHSNIINWTETFTNNGSGSKNMRNRYDILIELFGY